MLVKCVTKLYFPPRKREGITHCKDAPPAEGPNVELEELPKPSCAGAAALLILAALTFLPVRPMPPLSRGIKEHLQADRQQIRQSLLAATPHMDMGQGWGRPHTRRRHCAPR